MASSEVFYAPSVAVVNCCKKDELVQTADHYGIMVAKKNRKEEIRRELFEQGVLQEEELGAAAVESAPMPLSVTMVVQMVGRIFEQQKELLVIQFEQENLHLKVDRDKNLSRKE